MNIKPVIIITSVPNQEIGESIGNELINRNLAACVHVLPAGVSIYKWDNKINRDSEYQLLIKTLINNELEIYNLIKSNHPYEIPEILTILVNSGEEAYLKWMDAVVNKQ
jgi:periplasmic divalent cation tolerance protein